MIGLDGAVHVIRHGEDLDYVQQLEEVPGHLERFKRASDAGQAPPVPILGRIDGAAHFTPGRES
jgi:hypothetical protein